MSITRTINQQLNGIQKIIDVNELPQECFDIFQDVCRRREITPMQIIGRQRAQRFVVARKDIALGCKSFMSSIQIGKLLQRDHTTILYYWDSF